MQIHSEILENKGIRPSVQRVRIFKFLMQSKQHPTVEMIFNALLPEMPSLSRTTVYNTVELFKECECPECRLRNEPVSHQTESAVEWSERYAAFLEDVAERPVRI